MKMNSPVVPAAYAMTLSSIPSDYDDSAMFEGQVDVRPSPPDPNSVMGIYQLYAMSFPFSVPSTNGADIGINYNTVFGDERGAHVRIFIYLNRDAGDIITFRFVGVDVPIPPIEVPSGLTADDDVETFIHSRYFRQAVQLSPNRNLQMQYTIKRKSDNQSEDSLIANIQIKIDRPGGEDPDAAPGHQNLKSPLLPEKLIAEGAVTQSWIDSGVAVRIPHYEFMTLGDVITLLWGSALIAHTVTTVIQPGEFTELLVSGDKILEAGNSTGLPIRYWIVDTLLNSSSDFSEITRIPVKTGETRLRAPSVKQVDEQDRLFLDDLKGGPATVFVIAFDPPFMRGDTIILTLSVPVAGEADRVLYVVEKPVSQLSIVEIEVANETLLDVPPGIVKARYELKKADQSLIPSNPYSFILVAKAILLGQPRVLEARRGHVSHTLGRAIVEVPTFLDRKVNQRITVYWLVTRPNGQTHLYETYRLVTSALVNRPIPFNVSGSEHINRFNMSKLQVRYKVTEPDGVTERFSDVTRLHIGDALAHYPAPDFHPSYGPVIENGILLPEKISGFIDAYIAALKDLKLREKLYFQWENESGEIIFKEELDIVPSNIIYDFFYLLEACLFESQLHRDAHMFYWVESATDWPRASAELVFHIGEVVLEIERLEDRQGEVRDITFETSVKVTARARPNRSVNVYNQGVLVGSYATDNEGIFTFVLDNLLPGLQIIVLEGRYGNNPRSDAREFSVLLAQTPLITSIKTPDGTEIPHGQSTIARILTLTGDASPLQTVAIQSIVEPIGTATANGQGIWALKVGPLSYDLHHFTAKAQYGTGVPPSPTRLVRVVEGITPVISSCADVRGTHIPRGGNTYSRSVRLNGTATAGQLVQILVNSVSQQNVLVAQNGTWTAFLAGLPVGSYSIVVKPLYGGANSAPWAFNLLQWLINDLTTFDHWNGWVRGPAGSARDLTLRHEQGNWRLNNYTHAENSAGVVIQKTFTNLEINANYRFHVGLVRYDGRYAYPILSLLVNGGAITSPLSLTSRVWTTLWGNFVATSSTMTVQVYSHVNTGNGNDWEGDNFQIIHL
jgi:hypothetical protein